MLEVDVEVSHFPPICSCIIQYMLQVTSQLSTSSSNSQPHTDRWDFPRHRLKFFNILGQGAFGQVWRCEAIDIDGKSHIIRLVSFHIPNTDITMPKIRIECREFVFLFYFFFYCASSCIFHLSCSQFALPVPSLSFLDPILKHPLRNGSRCKDRHIQK